MSNPSKQTFLTKQYYVTLILRLGLDQEGHLIKGELVDTVGSRPKHFVDLESLNHVIEAWFKDNSRLNNAANNSGSTQ